MSRKFNYTVAPHLEEFDLPFPTFRATRPEYTDFVAGGLIFSRTASKEPEPGNRPLRVLLLQRSFEDSFGGYWEGPGGACDPDDESLLQGAAREVFEECGLHVSRFVELVATDQWVSTRSAQVKVVLKVTFIVEVHEALPAVSDHGPGAEEPNGLPADKPQDGGALPHLSRRWEDAVKLNPEEHQAFEWATLEEVQDAIQQKSDKFKFTNKQGLAIERAFELLSTNLSA